MGRIIFVPIGIIGGLIAGQLSKKIFDFIWSRISDEEAPEPERRLDRIRAIHKHGRRSGVLGPLLARPGAGEAQVARSGAAVD
jgi:hypothetical protein